MSPPPAGAARARGHARAGRAGHPRQFPVTHAVLDAAALVREVLPAYDLGPVRECRLHMRHISDTYFVRAAARPGEPPGAAPGDPPTGGRYVLRAYRAGWRSDDEIRYELDALKHLAARGVAVSTPITPPDGEALRSVPAPEGRRQLVLFTFALGDEDATRDDRARLYGRAAGAVHAASADFASPHPRPPIDIDALFERPLRALAPLLRERPRERRTLSALARRLRAYAGAFPFAQLEAGFCHGDLHGGNAGVAGDALTLFDFDLCGPGWWAYDVAVFRWGLTGDWLAEAEAERRWGLFLEGYGERRPLAAPDLGAVPFFMLLRQFWFMGLWGANGRDWGYRWPTSDGFLEQSMRFFRTWEPRL